MVVLGSKPRLEGFTLASRCWSCLLPGWGGWGSPFPHPCAGSGLSLGVSCPFRRMLFLLFESLKESLWPGLLFRHSAVEGQLLFPRQPAAEVALGWGRCRGARGDAQEGMAELQKVLDPAVVPGRAGGDGQQVEGLLEKTGALCFPAIQKPKFTALKSVQGKPAQVSRIPRALWPRVGGSFTALVQAGLVATLILLSLPCPLCEPGWLKALAARWVCSPVHCPGWWRRRPKGAGRSPEPGWESGCWLRIPRWLLAFTSPFV